MDEFKRSIEWNFRVKAVSKSDIPERYGSHPERKVFLQFDKKNMFRYIMLLTELIKSVFFLIALTLGFQGKLVLLWKRLTAKQCSRQGFE